MEEKVYLWFSEVEARKGKFFYVPGDTDKKLIKCTAMTNKQIAPCGSSKYLKEVNVKTV